MPTSAGQFDSGSTTATPPSPDSDAPPPLPPPLHHPDVRVDPATGARSIGPPAKPFPSLERHTHRLNRATFAPAAGGDGERWQDGDGDEVDVFFQGEWGAVVRVRSDLRGEEREKKAQQLVVFRSVWMRRIEVKVDRWLDKEGSTVTITLDFTPSLDADDARKSVLHTLTLDVNVHHEAGFNTDRFEKLKPRFKRWAIVEGDLPEQKRSGPCACSVSPFRALTIPLPGQTLAPWGPPPSSFDPNNSRTWVPPLPPMPIRVRPAPAPAPVVPNTRVMRHTLDSSDDDHSSDNDHEEEADVEDVVERKTAPKKSASGFLRQALDQPPRKRRRSNSTATDAPSRAEFDALKADFEQSRLSNEGLRVEVAELRGMLVELKQVVAAKAAVAPASTPPPAVEVEFEAPEESEEEPEDNPIRDLPPNGDVDSSDLSELDDVEQSALHTVLKARATRRRSKSWLR